MLALLALSGLLSFAVSLVLAIRLLRLWRRTRGLPELAVGLSFLSAGVVGWALMLCSNVAPVSASTLLVLVSAGYACITLGVVLNYLFTWQVFRRGERWAAGLFWLATGALCLTCVPLQAEGFGALHAHLPVGPLTSLGNVARIGAGVWGAIECGRYYRLMRKRLALGIADPVVVNRFALWCGASSAMAGLMLYTALWPPADPDAIDTLAILVISLLTIAVGACQWLAFVPPRRYEAWLRRRASTS